MGDFDGIPNRRDNGKKHREEAKRKRQREDEEMDNDYLLSIQGLIRCAECKQPFHQSLAQCPYCGAPRSRLMT
jgi:rubrerythrin